MQQEVPEQSERLSGYKDHLRKKKASGCSRVKSVQVPWVAAARLCYVLWGRWTLYSCLHCSDATLSPALCRNFESHKSQYSFTSRKSYIFRQTATIFPTMPPPSVLMPTQKTEASGSYIFLEYLLKYKDSLRSMIQFILRLQGKAVMKMTGKCSARRAGEYTMSLICLFSYGRGSPL